MIRAVVFLAVIACAWAFAPSGVRMSTRSSLKMNLDEESIGALPPVGFWDPLGTPSRLLDGQVFSLS